VGDIVVDAEGVTPAFSGVAAIAGAEVGAVSAGAVLASSGSSGAQAARIELATTLLPTMVAIIFIASRRYALFLVVLYKFIHQIFLKQVHGSSRFTRIARL
jgi:hypothetical protein